MVALEGSVTRVARPSLIDASRHVTNVALVPNFWPTLGLKRLCHITRLVSNRLSSRSTVILGLFQARTCSPDQLYTELDADLVIGSVVIEAPPFVVDNYLHWSDHVEQSNFCRRGRSCWSLYHR
jgi:hypothetical protein